MMITDNSQVMLTETIKFDPSLKLSEGLKCFCSFYSQMNDLLIFTFAGGNCVAGQVDFESNTFSGFKINPYDDPDNAGSNFRNSWSKSGENLVQFKDLGKILSKGQTKGYISAISRKAGTDFGGLPILL
jgi:hypothetical protein